MGPSDSTSPGGHTCVSKVTTSNPTLHKPSKTVHADRQPIGARSSGGAARSQCRGFSKESTPYVPRPRRSPRLLRAATWPAQKNDDDDKNDDDHVLGHEEGHGRGAWAQPKHPKSSYFLLVLLVLLFLLVFYCIYYIYWFLLHFIAFTRWDIFVIAR